jgi:sec-independent protein translocase protein TatB
MALAFIFDGAGFGEWLVLLAVLLVVVGPKNLPSAARSFGRQYAKLKRLADSFRRQIMDMDREIDRVIEDSEIELESAFTMEGDESSVVPEPPPEPPPANPEPVQSEPEATEPAQTKPAQPEKPVPGAVEPEN